MLTAVFANGTGVITPGNIAVTSGVAVSVSPTATTTYTLTVTPPAVGTAITQTATVTVNPVQTTPTITSFAAGPHRRSRQENSTSLTAVFAGGTGVITPGNIAVTSMSACERQPGDDHDLYAHCHSRLLGRRSRRWRPSPLIRRRRSPALLPTPQALGREEART